MTLEEFQKLDGDERLPIVREDGKYIQQIIYKGEAISLIAVSTFFVELIHTDETFKNVHSMRTFSNGPQLDKYSENLSNLFD